MKQSKSSQIIKSYPSNMHKNDILEECYKFEVKR